MTKYVLLYLPFHDDWTPDAVAVFEFDELLARLERAKEISGKLKSLKEELNTHDVESTTYWVAWYGDWIATLDALGLDESGNKILVIETDDESDPQEEPAWIAQNDELYGDVHEEIDAFGLIKYKFVQKHTDYWAGMSFTISKLLADLPGLPVIQVTIPEESEEESE